MGKSTTQTTKENSQTQGTQDSQSWNYSPTYIQDAAKNLVATGTGMTAPFLNVPNFGIAGFTPDQLAAMDFTRDIAQQRGENTYKWYQGARDYVGDATYNPFSASSSNAATVDTGRVNDLTGQFMNPFQSAVIDATTRRMGQDRDASAARIRAQAAGASPFGGSGEAIQLAQLDKNYGDTLSSTVAGLQSQGYGQALSQALGIAGQEASNRQATSLSNAQMAQQAAQTNAAASAASEDTRRARGMQGLQMGSALESEDLQRQLLGLQTLMGSGQQQQDLAQQAIQYPWGILSILQGLTPQDQTMTQYGLGNAFQNKQGTKETESSGGGSLLSGLMGLAALPMGGGVSLGGAIAGKVLGGCDRSLKTDIEEIGLDEETGLKIYAFRYKADPKTYPKTIGVMADEVEERFPGSTVMLAGKRLIRMERAAG